MSFRPAVAPEGPPSRWPWRHRSRRWIRRVLTAIAFALLAAGCGIGSGDPTPEGGSTASERTTSSALTTEGRSAEEPAVTDNAAEPATSPSTTCPPYVPPLPASMDCSAFDAAAHEPMVEAMLADDAVPLPVSVSPPTRTRVLAVGDSIMAEAHRFLVPLGAVQGIDVTVHAVSGSAPCDWADALEAILPTVDPDLVVFGFSGNAFTECMTDRPIGSRAFYERYEEASNELTDLATAAGSAVWWMEILPFATDLAERQRIPLDAMYEELGETTGLVPTRVLFESETGEFSTELGCRFPWEPCGSVRVRSDDGVHLGSETSPYGALRYAISILAFAECWVDERQGQNQ